MLGWIILLVFLTFFVYYGYHLIVRKAGEGEEAGGLTAACHLCREKFPVTKMVAREKQAGFVNYFCAECIEGLYSDLKQMK